MIIKRFNEELMHPDWYKPTDKILKVSVNDFEVKLSEIEETTAYQRAYDKNLDKGMYEKRAKKDAIYYGIEEWLYTTGGATIKFELVDKFDNPIEDIEQFDTTNKYNL